MTTNNEFTIRPREPGDLDALVHVAEQVHQLDGYPPYLPDGDLLGFLTSEEALASWVAVETPIPGDEQTTQAMSAKASVVGHIALNRWSSFEVLDLAETALGTGAGGLAVAARLMVAPHARRSGVAAKLLEVATQAGWALDRWPILDVVDHFAPAIALYERSGWSHLGTVEVALPDRTMLRERVYAAPRRPETSDPS